MRKITQYDLIQEYIARYLAYPAIEHPNHIVVGKDKVGRTILEIQNELRLLGENATSADIVNLLGYDINMTCYICNRKISYGIELPGDEYNMYFCPDCVDKMNVMI